MDPEIFIHGSAHIGQGLLAHTTNRVVDPSEILKLGLKFYILHYNS